MALVDSLASESCTSLGSGSSGSSVETVVHSSDLKSKLLELQAVRAGQDNVIAELRGKLNANESELRALVGVVESCAVGQRVLILVCFCFFCFSAQRLRQQRAQVVFNTHGDCETD